MSRLFRDAESLHEDEIISKAKIVVMTNSNASKARILRKLKAGEFSLLCVDEAGFALDDEILPLIIHARRLIMAGDPLQLPPVVQCEEAKKKGYGVSLLERLCDVMPENVSLLATQYRSNSVISDWSSKYFYGGKVVAAPSVAKSVLSDVANVRSSKLTNSPLIFVNTKGKQFCEESDVDLDANDESVCNYDEAFVIELLVRKFISLGVKSSSVGIITPYWAQVSVLRTLIWTDETLKDVEIRTVDGYQGREKELIVLSLVRSNERGSVGFLRETRRINVSVTRAKKCCVVVGDSETLTCDEGLRSLYEYCYENRAVVSVQNILSEEQ